MSVFTITSVLSATVVFVAMLGALEVGRRIALRRPREEEGIIRLDAADEVLTRLRATMR